MTGMLFSVSEYRYLRLDRSGRLLVACWRPWFPDGLPDRVYASAQLGRLLLVAPSLLAASCAGTPVGIFQATGPVPRIYLGARLKPLLRVAGVQPGGWVHVTIEPQRLVLRPAGVAR
ncbi:MAG: hypothetical protein ACYDH5_07840 [Acidimicrobiales bacterium]